MTRRLSTLVAICALALCAFGGTASADQPDSPGCEGRDTAFFVHFSQETLDSRGFNGALEAAGLTREQFEAGQELFCADFVEPPV